MGRRNNPNDAKQTDTPAARFLRSAKLRRARDLKQLSILCEAVQGISELIHALQKERGASSIYLGSNGAQFADRLVARAAESGSLEERVRNRLEHVDEKLDPMSCSARFYTRVAFAFRALDSLPGTREQVSALALAPQDAVKAFTEVIALLLAVGFEAADVAVDPETSRALIALVNFAQGKEYAGQERATAGAALSRGHLGGADRRLLLHLAAAQERALIIFTQFADPRHVALFLELDGSPETAAFKQMRADALGQDPGIDSPAMIADRWYEVTTRRIDAMRIIEDGVAADLGRLCALKLAKSKGKSGRVDATGGEALRHASAFAMLVSDVDSAAHGLGMAGGIELYGMDAALPAPMRSILDVVEAQSRRIDDINCQLETARVALTERKTIERAKGMLMRSRRLCEKDAYTLLRQTAMSQNKRIYDVAEAIIGMADILGT
ncbi:MAG: nitrate- and nitrite sensing domain-containing protein [Steroidobacteraceae bacterium]